MPDLEFVIKTRSELAGAQAAATALERQIGQAKALGKDYKDLDSQLQRVRSSISGAQISDDSSFSGKLREHLRELIPGFGKLEGAIGKIGAGGLGILAAAFAALGAAAGAAKRGISEYAGAQTEMAKVDAALALSGQLTDGYRERIQELADELMRATGIADEQWMAVLARLTQFGADDTNISRYAEAVKNLAGIMGGDIQGAANMFSRAMQGNYQRFSLYGIAVGDAATQTEKLNDLMTQLAQRGGGQLEAQTQTLIGQFKSMSNNIGEFFEAIGRGISKLGILQKVMGAISVFFEAWAEILGGPIERLKGLENAATRTKQSFEDSKGAAEVYKQQLEGIKTAADAAAKALDRVIADIEKQQSREDRLAQKRKDLELAGVEYQEAKGQISPVTAAGKRLEIEGRYDRAKIQRDKQAEAAKVAAETTAERQSVGTEVDLQDTIAKLEKERAGLGSVEGRQALIAELSSWSVGEGESHGLEPARKKRDELVNEQLRRQNASPFSLTESLVGGISNEELERRAAEAEGEVKYYESLLASVKESKGRPRDVVDAELTSARERLKTQQGTTGSLFEQNRRRQGAAAADIGLGIQEAQLENEARTVRYGTTVARAEAQPATGAAGTDRLTQGSLQAHQDNQAFLAAVNLFVATYAKGLDAAAKGLEAAARQNVAINERLSAVNTHIFRLDNSLRDLNTRSAGQRY